ncbi:ribonuclease T2-like protein [Russula vinacea]|nr:ribonuclease T2-like protein [Russula vinacea]
MTEPSTPSHFAMFALLAILANLAIAVVSAQDPVPFNTSSTLFGSLTNCGTSGTPSCGGIHLKRTFVATSTQGCVFWDTRPSTGPVDSWTIHGSCDGSHASNCDRDRDYTDIPRVPLQEQGADEPICLPRDSPRGAEAVVFFQRVVELFKKLPTYDWLAAQGITPSESQTYTLSELTDALKSASGYTPAITCSGRAINQISWYFYVRGSLVDGEFVPIDSPLDSSCASSGLKYYPKSG